MAVAVRTGGEHEGGKVFVWRRQRGDWPGLGVLSGEGTEVLFGPTGKAEGIRRMGYGLYAYVLSILIKE